jgi:rhodanese-related sulfurtransferase
MDARLGEIPRDRPVVPYCNMQHPGNSRGERVTALLLARGYEARVLDGGFLKWQEEELPTDKGER